GRLGSRAGRLLGREKPGALRLGAEPLADAAGGLRGADDAAVGVPDRRHRQRDVDQGSVLPETHGLHVLDRVPAAAAAHDSALPTNDAAGWPSNSAARSFT